MINKYDVLLEFFWILLLDLFLLFLQMRTSTSGAAILPCCVSSAPTATRRRNEGTIGLKHAHMIENQ